MPMMNVPKLGVPDCVVVILVVVWVGELAEGIQAVQLVEYINLRHIGVVSKMPERVFEFRDCCGVLSQSSDVVGSYRNRSSKL